MFTIGVYSGKNYTIDLPCVYEYISQCCTMWETPSPIRYILYGTDEFIQSVDKWFQDSKYFSTNITRRSGSQRSTPRRLLKSCTHVIILVHEKDDEWIYLMKSLKSKVIAIK